MEKPLGKKVQFGICDKCYTHLADKGDLLTDTFMDTCVYHIHSKQAIPLSLLEDRYPIHIEYIIKQLEIEKYITSHETEQGVFILPVVVGKDRHIPIYCANRFLGCSRIVLEQNIND